MLLYLSNSSYAHNIAFVYTSTSITHIIRMDVGRVRINSNNLWSRAFVNLLGTVIMYFDGSQITKKKNDIQGGQKCPRWFWSCKWKQKLYQRFDCREVTKWMIWWKIRDIWFLFPRQSAALSHLYLRLFGFCLCNVIWHDIAVGCWVGWLMSQFIWLWYP